MSKLHQIGHQMFDLFFRHYIVGAFLLTVVTSFIQCGVYYAYNGELFYTDTDCYTRALRIIDWLSDFQWAEKMFPYYNPPHGFELHFTRICDVIWMFFTLPFLLFMPLKEAVFYGGMFFSPLFFGLSLATVLWGLKPYLPSNKNKQLIFMLFALIALCLLGKLINVFGFHRPDHHSLMCFIGCAVVAITLRHQIKPNINLLFWLGVLCGCGMWASSAIEGLFVVAFVLGSLAINRIFYRHNAKELLYYGIGLFLSVTFSWLVNPALGGYGVLDISRLSVIHVVLTALMMLAFWALAWLRTDNKFALICGFGGAAAVCAVLMLLIFGTQNLFTPIYNTEVYDVFVYRITEMKPQSLLEYETPSFVFGLLLIGTLMYLSRFKQSYAVHLLFFFCWTAFAALICKRLYPYYVAVFVFLYGIGWFLLMFRTEKSDKYKFFALLYVLIPIFYLNTFYAAPKRLSIPPMKENALLNLFYAPELMFYQNIDTVGGPYHSNIEGVIDNYHLWFSKDEAEVTALLKKHNVHSIYVKYDENLEPEKHTDQLFGQIMSGKNLYKWLIKIEDCHYEIDYDILEKQLNLH